MKALEILPAIDVKEGVAIRLAKGELDKQSKYGDPLEVAAEFTSSGVSWIHLVDLDAAFAAIGDMPRQSEWAAFMDGFQQRLVEAKPNEHWAKMNCIFTL